MRERWWVITFYGPVLLRQFPVLFRDCWRNIWQDGGAYMAQNIRWALSPDWLWETSFGKTLCEAQGHPAGVRWYNPCGFEPDMRCNRCGTDLG
jgi:hypothetical protein